MTEPLTIAEWREKNVRWCDVCLCETMPNDRTGRCFWCDTKLMEPTDVINGTLMVTCHYPNCTEVFAVNPRGKTREFCSDRHRKDWWFKYTPEGRAWREKDRLARLERKRLAYAAAKKDAA